MYISGSSYSFKNRLHQFPTGIYDLNAFWTEYQSIISGFNYISLIKINREFPHKYYELTTKTYQSGALTGI